jgi:PPOX class probable F420-dependent enzyme
MAPADFSAFLAEPHVAVIATLRADGAPYTVPIWFHWDEDAALPALEFGHVAYPGGHLWIVGTYPRVWCQQLMRDGRSSLCIESGAPMTAHVEFDGVCEPFELPGFDIWPIARTLAEKYVGRRDPANAAAVDAFFANMQTEPRLLFRMTPRRVRAIDMRVYRGKAADRAYQAERASD